MLVRFMSVATPQALLEYGTVGSSSWWARAQGVGDRLLHWASSHPLEVVLAGIGLLVLYKFMRP